MVQAIIPPAAPGQHEPIRPPMIYIEQPLKWEYKLVTRELDKEKPPAKAELNALGEEGWELVGVAQQPPTAYFYFKRPVER